MAGHATTWDGLRALITVAPLTGEQARVVQPEPFLRRVLGVDGPSRMNQGNRAIAQHRISKEACLAGLKDVVLQTPEQRRLCGADNMVPVWQGQKDPTFCIDVFEFPNRACELPLVWTPPTYAKKVCELEGKRLCAQPEWNLACRGDPDGAADRRYAYGDTLDLAVCNTHQPHRQSCVAKSAQTAWATCTTDTEPSGSFPQCRSRFGVFDQHGNVAEVMMRREGAVIDPARGAMPAGGGSSTVFTQLKGSAWFYEELAREPEQPVPASTPNKPGAYPDHCNFDPRWHVEKLESAWHVNYHLGFRCCKSIP